MEECYPGIDESREIGRWRWAGEGVAADRGGEARAEGGACSGESAERGRWIGGSVDGSWVRGRGREESRSEGKTDGDDDRANTCWPQTRAVTQHERMRIVEDGDMRPVCGRL